MRIQNGSTVTLNYTVTSEDGELIDPGAEPMVYLHGDLEGLFPKLQAALDGKGLDDTITITLAAEDAFGPYDRSLVRMEHRGATGLFKLASARDRDAQIDDPIHVVPITLEIVT